MWQETADLVTFTEEILNGKLHFLCSDGPRHVQNLAVFATKLLTWFDHFVDIRH